MSGWPLEPGRLVAAAGVVSAYAALLVATFLRHRPRADAAKGEGASIAVLHASQTGTAQGIARATADLLREAGHAARVASLGEVSLAQLRAHRRALFIVSTCGEGDAPDEALPFLRDVMADDAPPREPALAGLHVGVLALGDRRFAHFCGFARRVEGWLHAHGAQPMFGRVDVDALAPADLARWQQALSALAGVQVDSWRPTPATRPWRLAARRVLNPGSVGEPVLHLEFEPEDGAARPTWQPGDLVRLVLPDGAGTRDYSIASVPADGRLHLAVRRVRRTDGGFGLASGWLAQAGIGSRAELGLVDHPTFRLGDNAGRPLVLVGNGTGIAGLRSHLRARAAEPGARHWLLFGERQRAHDFHFEAEIQDWRASGVLERVDLAFSRDDDDGPRHVQHLLRAAPGTLRAWIADGAALYVCGSREGMAQGVDEALREILGDAGVDGLAREGRYRRDVY